MRHVIFYLQLLAIISVSMLDIFYTSLTRDTILAAEQNPVAKWIIKNYGVDMFISIKTATTCLVVLILQWAYYNTKDKSKKALWVILAGITIFQLWLLIFLTMPPAVWAKWIKIPFFLGL